MFCIYIQINNLVRPNEWPKKNKVINYTHTEFDTQ